MTATTKMVDELNRELFRINSQKDSVKSMVKSITDDKIQNIQELLNEINEMIEERKSLSELLNLSYEKVLIKVNNIISRIPNEAIKEELQLHTKILEIEEAKIKEKLDCWRDIALLKKELREQLSLFRDEEKKQANYSDLLD